MQFLFQMTKTLCFFLLQLLHRNLRPVSDHIGNFFLVHLQFMILALFFLLLLQFMYLFFCFHLLSLHLTGKYKVLLTDSLFLLLFKRNPLFL